jgi:hypothetical protein
VDPGGGIAEGVCEGGEVADQVVGIAGDAAPGIFLCGEAVEVVVGVEGGVAQRVGEGEEQPTLAYR